MPSKKERQQRIERIIEQGTFHTQQEIIAALEEEGIQVKQGTLSKDFKALNVIKRPTADGSFRYVLLRNYSIQDDPVAREIRDFVRGVDEAGHLAVIKTTSGHASAVCETIDQAGWPEVIGTIAGENTILIVCRTPGLAQQFVARVRTLMEEKKEQA
jgi:transcriptional regulator of arginine metabolism